MTSTEEKRTASDNKKTNGEKTHKEANIKTANALGGLHVEHKDRMSRRPTTSDKHGLTTKTEQRRQKQEPKKRARKKQRQKRKEERRPSIRTGK